MKLFPTIKRVFLLSTLIVCSINASEPAEEVYDPAFLTHALFIAEEHRSQFIDEIREVPNEKLVLFTLGPGGGNHYGQYSEAIKMQKVPVYFIALAEAFPSISAKIFAIDPSFTLDTKASEYAFLYENGWELAIEPEDYPRQPPRFTKGNIEIVFYKFVIPDSYAGEMLKSVTDYASSVLDSGGCVFMGHHASAFGVLPVFSEVYNKLQSQPNKNNLLMYVCSGDTPPWSSPKVYHNIPYSSGELKTLYSKLCPLFESWMPNGKWDELSWEQQLKIMADYQEGFSPSYQEYDDLKCLDAKAEIIDGNFHLQLSETAAKDSFLR